MMGLRIVKGKKITQPRFELFGHKHHHLHYEQRYSRSRRSLSETTQQMLYRVIVETSKSLGVFTTDDIWSRVSGELPRGYDTRGIGRVLLKAQRNREIVTTKRRIKSSRKVCHGRSITVWKRYGRTDLSV